MTKENECSEPGCDHEVKARGLCITHYSQVRGADQGDFRRIYIAELAEVVNRRRATIRRWCNSRDSSPTLPPELMPQRVITQTTQDGWRYWTEEQVEGIKVWMRENNVRPGSGLNHYRPTPAQEDALIERMRRSDRKAA